MTDVEDLTFTGAAAGAGAGAAFLPSFFDLFALLSTAGTAAAVTLVALAIIRGVNLVERVRKKL